MEVFDTGNIQVKTQPGGHSEVWDQVAEELDDGEERHLPGHNVRELWGEKYPVQIKHQVTCS